MSAQALVDPFLIHHLDADFDQPCDGYGTDCPSPAVWIVWVGVCCKASETTWVWCPAHLEGALALRNLTCDLCGAGVFPNGRDVIRLIEPLNRRTK